MKLLPHPGWRLEELGVYPRNPLLQCEGDAGRCEAEDREAYLVGEFQVSRF